MAEGQLKIVRRDGSVVRIRPVVEPTEPPDRTFVEGAPEPMASKGKARATRVKPEDREVAVARVKALQKSGNTRKSAMTSVGKELGFSFSALNKWLIASDKLVKGEKARAKADKPSSRGSKKEFILAHPDEGVSDLVALARKSGIGLTEAHVYAIRRAASGKAKAKPNGAPVAPRRMRQATRNAGLDELLSTVSSAVEEIRRRLSQLTL